MAVAIFNAPDHDDPLYVRAEAILALSNTFQWDGRVRGRTLYLANGQVLLVADSDATIAAAVGAMGTANDVATAVAIGQTRRDAPVPAPVKVAP